MRVLHCTTVGEHRERSTEDDERLQLCAIGERMNLDKLLDNSGADQLDKLIRIEAIHG